MPPPPVLATITGVTVAITGNFLVVAFDQILDGSSWDPSKFTDTTTGLPMVFVNPCDAVGNITAWPSQFANLDPNDLTPMLPGDGWTLANTWLGVTTPAAGTVS